MQLSYCRIHEMESDVEVHLRLQADADSLDWAKQHVRNWPVGRGHFLGRTALLRIGIPVHSHDETTFQIKGANPTESDLLYTDGEIVSFFAGIKRDEFDV